LVCLLIGLPSTWSQATDGINLSAADEQAYQEACTAWKRLAEVHEEAGIPPPADPPNREDFSDYTAQRAEAVTSDAIARVAAEALWQQRIQDAKPYLRTIARPTDRNDFRSRTAVQERGHLLQVADERFLKQPHIEAAMDEIAERHGVERVEAIDEDRFSRLAGEINNHPLWHISQNMIAAASISADELWPTNMTPWPSAGTGLDLSGDEITLGVWEVGGAARESHSEFQGRVFQVDQNATNPIPLGGHATGVAGTMVAGGVISLAAPGVTGMLMRATAFEADLDAYELGEFAFEIADATAGTTNTPGLRLSNHSYGLGSGWQFGSPATGFWNWWGSFSVVEEAKFGWYSPDLGDGTGSASLDAFMSEDATRHLFVYAAGNDRLIGPGSPVDYWYFNPSVPGWVLSTNPPANERQWFDGDGGTYGFDTILVPGTAKNALTVGSVRDVYHVVGGQTNWGYTTNSVVSVSSWSAAGPTDDGRIKPDVVAIGEANPSVRPFAIVTPRHFTDTDFQQTAGTSFAAPSVTAGFALMLQRRNQIFPSLDPDIDDWRGSTLKALAIHTADNLGDPGPSYITGWGLFNAVSMVRQTELDAFDGRGTHIKEIFLDIDESLSWWVYSDGSEPLKVTIAWSDPAGDPPLTLTVDDPTPMLVNNLDLTIQDESQSETWMPWILDPDLTNKTEAARADAATAGYDDRNNVEQVYIAEPDEGYYLITVEHAGGHSGGPSPTGQWVSVISSGDIPLPPRSVELELAPAGDEILLTFDADPGAYLFLETTTDLNDPQSWNLLGQVVTESTTNAVLVETDGELRFWRFRRETP
jgi:hypothetical protein